MRGVRVVGIAGPSGSGKTTLANALAERAGGVVFALDAYYRDQRHATEATIDVDIPDAIDKELAVLQARALMDGTAVAQPIYDYATHSRTDQTRLVEPARVVLIEGLFALYWPELRALIDTPVFMTLDHDVCLSRRIERDLRERGRSRDEVIDTYERKVRPMFDRYVAPTQRHARLVLDGREGVDRLAEEVLAALQPRNGLPGEIDR